MASIFFFETCIRSQLTRKRGIKSFFYKFLFKLQHIRLPVRETVHVQPLNNPNSCIPTHGNKTYKTSFNLFFPPYKRKKSVKNTIEIYYTLNKFDLVFFFVCFVLFFLTFNICILDYTYQEL